MMKNRIVNLSVKKVTSRDVQSRSYQLLAGNSLASLHIAGKLTNSLPPPPTKYYYKLTYNFKLTSVSLLFFVAYLTKANLLTLSQINFVQRSASAFQTGKRSKVLKLFRGDATTFESSFCRTFLSFLNNTVTFFGILAHRHSAIFIVPLPIYELMFFGTASSGAECRDIDALRNLGAKLTIIYSNLIIGNLNCQLQNAGSNLLTDNDVAYARYIKPRSQARPVPTVNSVGVDECAYAH